MHAGSRASPEPRLVRVAVAAGAVITIGTAADCGLVLTDPMVCGYHLEVCHAADGVALHDLGSRHGTFVGTTRVERAVVPPGTRVRIGATTIVVEDTGAPPLDRLPSYRDAKAAATAAFEKDYLTRLLAATGGNVSEAARRARMDRPYLIQLLRRHELK